MNSRLERYPQVPSFVDVDDEISAAELARNPYVRTLRAEESDRLGPMVAGALSGAAGGAGALYAASYLIKLRLPARDLIGELTAPLLRTFEFDETWEARVVTFLAAMLVGAVVGSIFAAMTHHLRRFLPMLLWTSVFFPSVWTLVYAFALPRLAPWLMTVAPFGAVAGALVVFALLFSLEVPLRVRRRLGV